MSPEQRFEGLAIADDIELKQLADLVLSAAVEVEVIEGPETVSAALRVPVPGTGSTTSVIGHVALTRCQVELGGVRGDGCREGHDLTGAVAAAVCDAEAERNGPNANAVRDLAQRSLAARHATWAERAGMVEMTRVQI